VTHHIPFRGNYIMHALVLPCINQQTKFEVPSFTIPKDMPPAPPIDSIWALVLVWW